jgi:hypothetical protein
VQSGSEDDDIVAGAELPGVEEPAIGVGDGDVERCHCSIDTLGHLVQSGERMEVHCLGEATPQCWVHLDRGLSVTQAAA